MKNCDIGFRIHFNKSIVDTDDLMLDFTIFNEEEIGAERLEFEEEDCWFTVKMFNTKWGYVETNLPPVKEKVFEFISQMQDGQSSCYYGIQFVIVESNEDEFGQGTAYSISRSYGDLGENHNLKARFDIQF